MISYLQSDKSPCIPLLFFVLYVAKISCFYDVSFVLRFRATAVAARSTLVIHLRADYMDTEQEQKRASSSGDGHGVAWHLVLYAKCVQVCKCVCGLYRSRRVVCRSEMLCGYWTRAAASFMNHASCRGTGWQRRQHTLPWSGCSSSLQIQTHVPWFAVDGGDC